MTVITDELTKAVVKALEKNHRNGPITARNLAGIFKNIIEANRSLSPDKIAALIHDADVKSDQDDEKGDD